MKVVINKCYGGFGLSAEGIMALCKLKNKSCYLFTSDYDTDKQKCSINSYNPETDKEVFIIDAYSIPNPQDYDSKALDEFYISTTNIKRNDPDLVKVIETLGSKKVSGRFSELAVVEIPDDVEWTIQDYDGVEWIAEKHRTWG